MAAVGCGIIFCHGIKNLLVFFFFFLIFFKFLLLLLLLLFLCFVWYHSIIDT